jgi:hypothetical protein
MAAPTAGALTAFETARAENIRRNNQIMEKMGIPGLVPEELRLRAASGRSAGASRGRKRAAADRFAEEVTAGRRRSSRLANVPATVYTTFEEEEDLGDDAPARRRSSSARTTSHPSSDDALVRLLARS